jgi:hypothetical protein
MKKSITFIGELQFRTPESSGATFRARITAKKFAMIQRAVALIKEIDAECVEFIDDVEIFSDSWVPQEDEILAGADSGCYEWGDKAEPWSADLEIRTAACRLCVGEHSFWWSCEDWNDVDRYETQEIFIDNFVASHV